MKPRANKKKSQRPAVVALAMTWDGARFPARSLPVKARAFLHRAGKVAPCPTPEKMAKLFAEDLVSEMRVCWVPRLRGEDQVLAVPFATADGLRVRFAPAKRRKFGEVLGIIYRRVSS